MVSFKTLALFSLFGITSKFCTAQKTVADSLNLPNGYVLKPTLQLPQTSRPVIKSTAVVQTTDTTDFANIPAVEDVKPIFTPINGTCVEKNLSVTPDAYQTIIAKPHLVKIVKDFAGKMPSERDSIKSAFGYWSLRATNQKADNYAVLFDGRRTNDSTMRQNLSRLIAIKPVADRVFFGIYNTSKKIAPLVMQVWGNASLVSASQNNLDIAAGRAPFKANAIITKKDSTQQQGHPPKP